MRRILVTGSSGLIGSEMVEYFSSQGWEVHGVDNNARKTFFGEQGDTSWNRDRLVREVRGFTHHEASILDRDGITALVKDIAPDAVVHTAAQPSHDRAAAIPYLDFETNAVGTLNMLEAVRQHAIAAPFVHLSTNKVYGDAPNEIRMRELETRWDYDDPAYVEGIPETMRIDHSTHSIFGASKVAADVLVQEYGRYFGMHTACLRGGCLTGPAHSGVELHGFLSYLVRCNLEGRLYRIFGYKGKQVRDNIHSLDVARFVDAFLKRPRSAAVYNLGGGKANTISILEAFAVAESITGNPMKSEYVDQNRVGDHICYYSDLRRMRADYPEWDIRIGVKECMQQIVDAWRSRLS
ncbi:NAD-dependent epimerase/dehydratase family protein [Pseudogemmatithrix spongiicola]|uniref:NAD-dependent epimerase/dehydratase family protein n=1 Tax=Pseudogemmatithrix spongiicola TaxID=3062599 RepID=A0AA49K0F4_9BACT|nr:NAD-dependent epimerase/dehydratase family protein [Gemmatimonadaceae bacterium 'strain 138']WKW15391.1 NAD-dependent epimerase/dehydratase family protein [Gemmatimonadaceae bacterium 'strain 318']